MHSRNFGGVILSSNPVSHILKFFVLHQRSKFLNSVEKIHLFQKKTRFCEENNWRCYRLPKSKSEGSNIFKIGVPLIKPKLLCLNSNSTGPTYPRSRNLPSKHSRIFCMNYKKNIYFSTYFFNDFGNNCPIYILRGHKGSTYASQYFQIKCRIL